MAEKVELKKSLGFFSGLSLVIGAVIGSGIFFKQADVIQAAGNSTTALMAWVIGGIITLAAALTISEVGAQLPNAGGLYSYIGTIYGDLPGFLTGWMQVIVYAPAVIAAVAGYAAFLTANFLGISNKYATIIAIIYLFFVVLINVMENTITAKFQIATSSVKLLPIIILVVYGLFFGKVHALGQTVHTLSSSTGGGIGVAILATLFAYDGWILLANISGEMKHPKKDFPRALIVGVTIVVIAYIGVTYAVIHTLPANEIVKLQNNATFEVVKTAFGNLGGKILSLGIIISMLGTLNGKMIAFPRMVYAMASDGLFPAKLSELNKKTKAPVNAIIFMFTITVLLLVFDTNQVNILSDLAIFSIWIFYTSTFIGVFILRKKNKNKEKDLLFKTPLYPITPIIAISGALFVLYSTIVSDLQGVLVSVGLVLLGIPVYLYYKNKNKK